MRNQELVWADYIWYDYQSTTNQHLLATTPHAFWYASNSKVIDLQLINQTFTEDSALVLEFFDYTQPILVNHPIKCSSLAKLGSLIKIDNYLIESAGSTNQQHRRTVTFGDNHPCYVNQIGPILVTEIPEFSNEHDSKTFYKIPNQYGQATLYRNIPLDETGSLVLDDKDLGNIQQTIKLPHYLRGVLPRTSRLAATTSPVTIANGLLMAAALGETELLVMLCKEIIQQAVNSNWITIDFNQGKCEPLHDGFSAGWPAAFIPTATQQELTFTECIVADQAYLGWALLTTLRKTQDQYPLGKVKLYGRYGLFKEAILQITTCLALYCTHGLNPVTKNMSYLSGSGTFSYDLTSLRTNLITCVFLNSYLSYKHDARIWYAAASLKENLDINPPSVTDPYWVDNLPEGALATLPFRILYDLHYSPSLVTTSAAAYNDLRTVETSHDWLVTLLLANNTQYTAPSDWWADTLLDEDWDAPQDNFNYIALITAAQHTYNCVVPLTDLHNESAKAIATYGIQELRQMLPYGTLWFDTENSIHSNIGSLLYAETELTFDWAIQALTNLGNSNLGIAQSEALQTWFNYLHGLNPYLCSDLFLKDWVGYFTTSATANESNLKTLLENLFGNPVTVTYPQLTEPFALYADSFLTTYQTPNSIYTPGVITAEQYLAIAYRAKIVSGKHKGITLRPVPGFPFPASPSRQPVVDAASYLANPTPGVYVADLYDHVIDPLDNYWPKGQLTISDVPDWFRKVLDNKVALPLTLEVNASSNVSDL